MLAEQMIATLTNKRATVSETGQRSTLVTVEEDIPCSPAYPDASGQLQERLRLQTPILLYRSFVAGGYDLALGDTIEITESADLRDPVTTTYRARGVTAYGEGMSAVMPGFTELILEKVVSV